MDILDEKLFTEMLFCLFWLWCWYEERENRWFLYNPSNLLTGNKNDSKPKKHQKAWHIKINSKQSVK